MIAPNLAQDELPRWVTSAALVRPEGTAPSGVRVFSIVRGGDMKQETRLVRFLVSRIAESARQVGVALVITGVVSLFFDPTKWIAGAGARCVGLAFLSVGWTQ